MGPLEANSARRNRQGKPRFGLLLELGPEASPANQFRIRDLLRGNASDSNNSVRDLELVDGYTESICRHLQQNPPSFGRGDSQRLSAYRYVSARCRFSLIRR